MKKLFRLKNLLLAFILAVIVNGYFIPAALACYQGDISCPGCDSAGFAVSEDDVPAGETGVEVEISGALIADEATGTVSPHHTIVFSGGTITAAVLNPLPTSSNESPTVGISHTSSTVTVTMSGGVDAPFAYTNYGVRITYNAPASPGDVTITNTIRTDEGGLFTGSNSFIIHVYPPNGDPTITPSSGSQTFAHSHAGGTTSRDFALDIGDGDAGESQTTTLTIPGCPAGFSIFGTNSVPDDYSTTLRFVQQNDGTIGTFSCTVVATDDGDPVASSTGTFTVILNNAAPVVTTSFGLCPDPGGKTLAALTVADPGCTSDGTVTITDSDDVGPFDVATATALPAGVSLVPSLPASFPAGPNGMQVVVADDFTGGTVIFRAEDMHDLAGYSPGVQIGPTGRRDPAEPPEVVYVDREPPNDPPPEENQCRIELYNDINRLFLEVSLESSAGTNDILHTDGTVTVIANDDQTGLPPMAGVLGTGFSVMRPTSLASTTDETGEQACGLTEEQIQAEIENIIDAGFVIIVNYSEAELRQIAIASLLGPGSICDSLDAVTDNFNRG